MALAKLIKEIQTFPKKLGWHQRFATPDGKAAPVPSKVEGWNAAWVEKKERIRNSEFRAREFFKESLRWKWSSDLRGPLKLPQSDNLSGFRVKDFMLEPQKPVWEKLESLYGDDEPLDEELEDEEFDDLLEHLDALETAKASSSSLMDKKEADIAPFRGMLLGLFFVTVGFSFDVQLITNHWFTVMPLLVALLVLKSGVVILVKRSGGLSFASSVQASALLAPGGEFALVLFRLAEQELTLLIQQAASSTEVIKILRAHQSRFDGIHAVTSLWRISKLPAAHLVENGAKDLEEVLGLVERHLEDVPLRGLSNILLALAYLEQLSVPHLPLAMRVALRLSRLLQAEPGRANHQDLSNSAWAAARLATFSKSAGHEVSELDELLQQLALLVAKDSGGLTPQGLSNVAWAYATAAVPGTPVATISRLRHEEEVRTAAMVQQNHPLDPRFQRFSGEFFAIQPELFEVFRKQLEHVLGAVASSATAKLHARPETFKVQEISNLAWAFAKLSLDASPLVAALASAASGRMKEFTTQNLCNFSWSLATLAVDSPWLGDASEEAQRSSLVAKQAQGLSNLVWASAMTQRSPHLFQQLSDELVERLLALDPQHAEAGEGISGTVRNTLGVIWAQSFTDAAEGRQLTSKVKPHLLALGRSKDAAGSGAPETVVVPRPQGPSSGLVDPQVVLELEDRLVLEKPPGWEVDQDKDIEASCGFLHRLDVPCSGLVIVAKTYEAYYDLLLQMNSGDTIRDYVVLCHGRISTPELTLREPLYWAEGTHLPTVVRSYGKPATTKIKCLAHGTRQVPGAMGTAAFSLLAVRILTGRRHQIRAHLASAGHPLVADGKYANERFAQDLWRQVVVSPHLSPPSLPGAGRPPGAPAPRLRGVALGPGPGAGALVGVLGHEMVNVLVTTSVMSMALTPLLAAAADVAAKRLREKRGLNTVEGRDEFAAVSVERLARADRGFVVICGYNVVGRTICRLLDSEGEAEYIVFEDDVKTAREGSDRS
eukprot:s51_g8.t1